MMSKVAHNKLTIQNVYKTEGLNIVGVSIDEWLTLTDRYDFLSHSHGHKWMYTLNRIANPDNKYELRLIVSDGSVYTTLLDIGEIKIKRLFYKHINNLVVEHLQQITYNIQNSITKLRNQL